MSRQEVHYRLVAAGEQREGALLVRPGMTDDEVREQARDVEDLGDDAVVVLDRGQVVGVSAQAAGDDDHRSNADDDTDGDD